MHAFLREAVRGLIAGRHHQRIVVAEQAGSGLEQFLLFFLRLGGTRAEEGLLVISGLRHHVLVVDTLGGEQADVVSGEIQLGGV